QTAEIVIPLRRLNVEEQRLIADAHFSAKDRLDARTPCRLHEFNRAVQVARVSERDSGQTVMPGQLEDGRRRECGIEKRVVTVRPQRHVAVSPLAIGDRRSAIVNRAPRYLGGWGFARRVTQPEVMLAQNNRVPPRSAEF